MAGEGGGVGGGALGGFGVGGDGQGLDELEGFGDVGLGGAAATFGHDEAVGDFEVPVGGDKGGQAGFEAFEHFQRGRRAFIPEDEANGDGAVEDEGFH